jgi:hypothetical protein
MRHVVGSRNFSIDSDYASDTFYTDFFGTTSRKQNIFGKYASSGECRTFNGFEKGSLINLSKNWQRVQGLRRLEECCQ